MKIPIKLRKGFYWFCSHCDWISSSLFALLTVAMGIDTKSDEYKSWPIFVLTWIDKVKPISIWLVLILAILAVFGVLYKRLHNPWVWEKLKFVLDGFRKKAYADFSGDREQYHKITLFRHQDFILFRQHWSGRWYWPWGKRRNPFGGWLVPVLRSGHKAATPKTVFYAPADGDSEGVAGCAWDAQAQIIPAETLPQLTDSSSESQKRKYAKRTFTSLEYIERAIELKKPLPLSLGAMPVFVHGKIWGVLVLDSQSSDGVTEEVLDNFSLTVEIIGQLLEKA